MCCKRFLKKHPANQELYCSKRVGSERDVGTVCGWGGWTRNENCVQEASDRCKVLQVRFYKKIQYLKPEKAFNSCNHAQCADSEVRNYFSVSNTE